MGGFISKNKKERKCRGGLQQRIKRNSLTLDWIARRRSKENRISTRSEKLDQGTYTRDTSNHRYSLTTIGNRAKTSTLNHSLFAPQNRLPLNTDATVKPKSVSKNLKVVLVHKILQTDFKHHSKIRRGKNNGSTSKTQQEDISVKLNSQIRDSENTDVDTQEVIVSREKINSLNNKITISDDELREASQAVERNVILKVDNEYPQKVNQKFEHQIKVNSLSDMFLDKSEVEKRKLVLRGQDVTNILVDNIYIKTNQKEELAKAVEATGKLKARSREENSVTKKLVDATLKSTSSSTTRHNDGINVNETIFKKPTSLNENAVIYENESLSDQVSKTGTTKNIEVIPLIQDTDRIEGSPSKYVLGNEFLPIICENVKHNIQETAVQVIDGTSKDSKPKYLLTDPKNEAVCKVVVYDEVATVVLENIEFGSSTIKLSQDDYISLYDDDKQVHRDPPPSSFKHVDAESPLETNTPLYFRTDSKYRTAFVMEDGDQIDLFDNKAEDEQENSNCDEYNSLSLRDPKEPFLKLTNEVKSNHNNEHHVTEILKSVKNHTLSLSLDVTVKQKDKRKTYPFTHEVLQQLKGLHDSKIITKRIDDISNNYIMQRSNNESGTATYVDKSWKDHTTEIHAINQIDDIALGSIMGIAKSNAISEDAVKLSTLSVTISVPKNQTTDFLSSGGEEIETSINPSVKKIEEIKCKAEPFRQEIKAFSGLDNSNKYFYIEESLRRLVDKLDDMYDEIGNDEWLRQRRKSVYKFIFSLFDALDEKVKVNACNT